MLGHRELNVEDYLLMLRRRVWWIMAPIVVVAILGAGVSLSIPNRYTSQTLVMVEGQKVPEQFVKSVVTEELNQRLGTMKEQIMSRTRLQPLIERFGLFKEDVGRVPMEDLVDRMRRMIDVTAIRQDVSFRGTSGVPGFYIKFTGDNPRLSQQVCQEITGMFISENLKLREQRAQGTTDFLKSQLEDAKRNLDTLDAKVRDFRTKYIGQMGGSEQSNLAMIQGQTARLEAVNQALTRAQQDKAFADQILAQGLEKWQASQATGDTPASVVPTEKMEQQLSVLQNNLDFMLQRYTPDHPDVVKTKADIAALKKRIEEANNATNAAKPPMTAAATGKGKTEPPQIQQMRYQVQLLDQSIKDKQHEQDQLKRDIATYQARIAMSPKIEEEGKAIMRDYQVALTTYNDMLNKQTQSEISTALERRQEGEQFRIMDPANLPEKPSYPNRPAFAGGGAAAGFMIGLVIAGLLELRDKAIYTERDVELYLNLPLLIMLPQLGAKRPRSAFVRRGESKRKGGGVGDDEKRGWRFWRRKKKPAVAPAAAARVAQPAEKLDAVPAEAK